MAFENNDGYTQSDFTTDRFGSAKSALVIQDGYNHMHYIYKFLFLFLIQCLFK